jgi:arsenite methyltransferase
LRVNGNREEVLTDRWSLRSRVRARETLFDRLSWFYTLCRERIFQDDTESIVQILASYGLVLNGARLIELGCGPGFYATRIAQRFRLLDVCGVDRSQKLVEHSRARARLRKLSNCRFERADVCALPFPHNSVDAAITSRLFMILENREAAMQEAFRVLKPGGLFFIAEPLSPSRAAAPLLTMRLLAALLRGFSQTDRGDYGEDIRLNVLPPPIFQKLLRLQSWARIVSWQTRHYQYAVCAKPGSAEDSGKGSASKVFVEDYSI